LTRFRFFRLLSYILTLVALYYIYLFIRDTKFDLKGRFFNLTNIPYLAIITLLYASTLFIGGYFWKKIISFVSGKDVSQYHLLQIYFRSNIGKYLPGNVGHYMGRNYYTNKIGISHFQAAFSSFVEVVLMITLPGIFILGLIVSGAVTLPPDISLGLNTNLLTTIAIVLALIAICYLGFIIYVRYFGKEKVKVFYSQWKLYLKQLISIKFMKLYLIGFVVMIVGFVVNGAILYLISYWIFDFDLGINNMLNFTTAGSVAGYAGIIVPGVPGGIGIKESLSVFLLSFYGYDKGLLAAIFIVSRICLIFSELLMFLFSLTAKLEQEKE
jgi:uncharacterized membrane protein YbhN (UPF0104 family)